jgi:hypothetical protein
MSVTLVLQVDVVRLCLCCSAAVLVLVEQVLTCKARVARSRLLC